MKTHPLLTISASAFADEQQVVKSLTKRLSPLEKQESHIRERAKAYIEAARLPRVQGTLEAFLQEYSLNNKEGLALMRLAEALLRIPDKATADALIRDMLGRKNWQAHIGQGNAWMVNAASLGLMISGRMVEQDTVLAKLAVRLGEPVLRAAIRGAMKHLGGLFVLGESIEEALKNARSYEKKGYFFSYDMLGEGARTEEQAERYLAAYMHAIEAISATGKGNKASISIKLSALHPRYAFAQKRRVMEELLSRLKILLLAAKQAAMMVSLDAEEATRLDIELELMEKLYRDSAFHGWEGFGFVVQAYQKRALPVIEFLAALAKDTGRKMPLRLVKGAYWDSEIKQAQVQGLENYPVFTRKEHTDISYLACADAMLGAGDVFSCQFATHNARTVASIREMAETYGVPVKAYEFQRLHGMGEGMYDTIVCDVSVRIYAPVGAHRDLLPYLIRRLLENGANSSFVHKLSDPATPIESLLENPINLAMQGGFCMHPDIPLPENLYGESRKNSQGLDTGNAAQVKALEEQLTVFRHHQWQAEPMLGGAVASNGQWQQVMEPADTKAKVGKVRFADAAEVEAALDYAKQAFLAWAAVPVNERALILNRLATAIEANKAELIALCAREAGRVLPDAVSEVREAADFCRYYAAQSVELMAKPDVLTGPTGEHNAVSLFPRGVFACISPWNFPLAIFTGQIVAALSTGNCVIAKPAEQTPLMAAKVVQLMLEAGIPKGVVQLLPGDGETVGTKLVKDSRIDGVVFTGSMETARIINQSLAARKGAIIPFIAETGGQNCMVVDASALLEQAVDDIIGSAFGSAGQRCSALRVLYVQEDVADELIHLLAGAMQQLTITDPLKLACDIGPVIDGEAKDNLLTHIRGMEKEARLIAAAPLPHALAVKGHYLAPHAFEISSIRELPEEIFGPILHVIRYKAGEEQNVADAINSTGYGLTFGIHSRIDSTVNFFSARVHAGNIYVNRSMIGAVVGVQPFGGEGLSGTGPKAGGAHYLLRFVTERTKTVNTAAIGGNVALLSGSS